MNQHGLFDWKFEWEKTKRIFGRCWFGRRTIGLSVHLCKVNDEAECFDTVLHEIAHALAFLKDGHRGHGKPWKRWCVMIGAKPQRCYSTKEVKVDFKYSIVRMSDGKVLSRRHRRPRWIAPNAPFALANVGGVCTRVKLVENNS